MSETKCKHCSNPICLENPKWRHSGPYGMHSCPPNGFTSAEPAEPSPDLADALAEALKAMLVVSDSGPQPTKLDEALSWRDCDDKAREMARAAVARWKTERKGK